MMHFKTLQEIIDLLNSLGFFVHDVEVKRDVAGVGHIHILKTSRGEWPVSRDFTGMFYFNVFDFIDYITYNESIRVVEVVEK